MIRRTIIAVAGGLLTACSGGTGTLDVTTYGEDFIEVGIPQAADGTEEGIVDGYAVTFDRFLVTFTNVSIEDRDGAIGAEMTTPTVYDLVQPGPHVVATFEDLNAQDWDVVGATIGPAVGAQVGMASQADVELMNQAGYSVYAEGEAQGATGTYRFAWGFDSATRYASCRDADDRAGVVVPSGGRSSIELTIHGDHLFYDDLQSEDPSLRFSAMAAVSGDDTEVTLDELATVDLTTLPVDQYGTGGDGRVENLRQFVESLIQTLLHFQGEGHCDSAPL